MRNLANVKRIVIKIGTSTLSNTHGINTAYIKTLAHEVKKAKDTGKQIIIVTSGAIGMGAAQLNITKRIEGIKMRQACAAIGQPLLMQEYRKAFLSNKIVTAQLLLTADVLSNRKTFLNLRNAFETLLELGTVPIINENDSISTDEINTAFGDNDRLSAFVASKIDADLLILLSDIDALYNKNPREHRDAVPIPYVFEITKEIEMGAGTAGTTHSSGGMKTKIEAAKIIQNAGCRMVLADGSEKNIISRILAGEEIGTMFLPKKKLSQRTRWILNSIPRGKILVDAGAVRALKNKKSLLPSGIQKIEGEFDAGEVVFVNDCIKAVTSFSSSELALLLGKHSKDIRHILGEGKKDVVSTPENIIFLDF
ncbi:MAG: glutamate 5-kinase [Spirochaetales bacterium]|nr:glutamate 5-kinase [Spirochaetales bacterium]